MDARRSQNSRPKLAILFWFYKELDLCRERLALLRWLNPGVTIYGLYGGEAGTGEAARRQVGPLVDDFWAYPHERTRDWRWRNGDQMINAWHEARGGDLPFDSIVVVQWDMLILTPVRRLFADLQLDEALFSGARPIHEVETWWGWAGAGDAEKAAEFQAFRALLKDRFDWTDAPWACLFIVVVLPRRFLDRYCAEGAPIVGFLEYKLPTLARVFGTPLRLDPRFDPWWAANPATREAGWPVRTLNAIGVEVPIRIVLETLANRAGRRVFHPVFKSFPWFLTLPGAARLRLAWLRQHDKGLDRASQTQS